MGKKGKGDLSAGKAAAKAAKKAKQEKLAERKATKADKKEKGKADAGKAGPKGSASKANKGKSSGANKANGGGGLDDDDDLDALLADFKAKWEEQHRTQEETVAEAPSRRANATLTPCPLGVDLWLFGGEYFDGDRATFFANLYRYTPSQAPVRQPTGDGEGDQPHDAGTWRSYASATQPGPRSAHQVAPSPANGGQLWLFGGEFASPRMTSFHHYRDLWVFSIATKQWERIDTKLRPSARSGHRMVCWKQYLILFGGFQDVGVRTTYLGDLWIFDTTQYKWYEIRQDELRKPPARSGFSFLPCAEGVLLYGGYCKRYVKGQRTQGVALEDAWLLRLEPSPDGDLLETGKVEWQRRRKVGYAPGARSGCTMALWTARNLGVLFGGVTDTEDDEESLESICHSDLFGYQLAGTGRWISLNLRRPKKKAGEARRKEKQAKAAAAAAAAARHRENGTANERSDSDEGDESEGDKDEGESADVDGSKEGKEVEPAEDPTDPQRSVPLGRYNAMTAVQRNTLYLYGGIHETADREYTLSDFYTLDLAKMERYVCHKACPIESLEWNESDDSGDDDDDDSSSGDESSDDHHRSGDRGGAGDDGEEEQEGVEWDPNAVEAVEAELESSGLLGDVADEDGEEARRRKLEAAMAERAELRKRAKEFLSGVAKGGGGANEARSEEDVASTPMPGETLKAFYERSRAYFAAAAYRQSEGHSRGKEMRRDGFSIAEKRYAEFEPMLREIERIQREAGLDADEIKAARAPGMAGGESRNRR